MSNNNKIALYKKLNTFIRKYYKNQLIKGVLMLLAIIGIFFIVFSILEYFSKFDVQVRTILFWSYITINSIVALKYIIIPLLNLFKIGKTLSKKEAAKIIGAHFHEIDDKLLNILELDEMKNDGNSLIEASINQKINKINSIKFNQAINFLENRKYLKWLFIPTIIIFIFLISGRQHILSESSARIIKHNTFFEPTSPFEYTILNKKLEAIQYNNFNLTVSVTGSQIPSEIFIIEGSNKLKLINLGENKYSCTFKNISSDIKFNFYAGGYNSNYYYLKVIRQPKVIHLETEIIPPKYTKKNITKIIADGDLDVIEGSLVNWNIEVQNTNNCFFILNNSLIEQTKSEKLTISKKIFQSCDYYIVTKNNELSDTLKYNLNIIKDLYPNVYISSSYDSINNDYLFNGTISDDYGISKVEFICENDSKTIINSIQVQITDDMYEKFFFNYNFENLTLTEGQVIYYYFKVWDNDNVNGPKYTKSSYFKYEKSTAKELLEKKDLLNDITKNSFQKSILMSNELEKEIEKLGRQILEKEKIGWEEKQKLENILKKQKQLETQIKKTQKTNEKNLANQKNLNSKLLDKQKELEKLMNSVLNKDTKKLIEEINDLISDPDKEKIKELLKKLSKENINLESELDRELELFKQLEFEQKTEEILNKIQEIKEKQESLLNKTEDSKDSKLSLEQEKIQKETSEMINELDNLREKNNDLENKNIIPVTKQNQEDILNQMQKSKNSLQKNQNKKAQNAQKTAIEKLSELEKQVKSIQANSSAKAEEDMEMLRGILENLITLSFNQESLIKTTSSLSINNSQFIRIAQNQKKLHVDSKIIKDSLVALSRRVVQIQSIINREISSIENQMSKTIDQLEKRNGKKAAERQQYVMTSSNNLALMLSEILEQMQKDIDSQSDCNKPRNCNKPNPNSNKPSMAQIREAQKKLNKKLGKQGEKNGKSKKSSKELMELARRQAEIRKQLLDIRNEIGENGNKGEIDRALQKMENNERDIINNNITNETFERQQEILSSMLDSDDAKREKDTDINRSSNEWLVDTNEKSNEYLKYKTQKKKEEELLKTTPINLNPFYKNKVRDYFKNILND